MTPEPGGGEEARHGGYHAEQQDDLEERDDDESGPVQHKQGECREQSQRQEPRPAPVADRPASPGPRYLPDLRSCWRRLGQIGQHSMQLPGGLRAQCGRDTLIQLFGGKPSGGEVLAQPLRDMLAVGV